MDFEKIMIRYMDRLLEGDRAGCRQILGESLQTGTPVNILYTSLFWPVMTEVEKLYRENQINRITEQMATRINRTLVDQLQSKLPRREIRGKKIIITCANDEQEELGAQMCSDLFESDGWEVKFIGSGVPNDEILSLVGQEQPDILFIYGTKPSGAPDIRKLIDTIRGISAAPHMRIMLSGGVFNRADGLWEEIGADLFAPTAQEALQVALTDRKHEPEIRTRRRRSVKIDLAQFVEAAAEIGG
jgi:methanogenic corrinoid protein MtbC1